jgi:purine-binding chemotaxis protein CheW
MTTDVLERSVTVDDEEERAFVTLMVANQLCGIPVLGVRDILGSHKITRIPLAPAEIAGSLNLRGRIVTAIDLRRRLRLPPASADQPRMSVVAEQGGELYALLVDQVSEVMSLKARSFERNRLRCHPPGRSSAAASIDSMEHYWWCWTWASCWRSAKPPEDHSHGTPLPGG